MMGWCPGRKPIEILKINSEEINLKLSYQENDVVISCRLNLKICSVNASVAKFIQSAPYGRMVQVSEPPLKKGKTEGAEGASQRSSVSQKSAVSSDNAAEEAADDVVLIRKVVAVPKGAVKKRMHKR